MKILSVVGARPNFIKIAPLVRAVRHDTSLKHVLVHTGQHYGDTMSHSFFRELDIPQPNINLNVGSLSHAQQTAKIMALFEPVLLEHRPDVVIVVGDVNSTMACTLVAAKLRIPVAHVEAGLRSFDRDMPEELNRLVTDSVSDVMFTTSTEAKAQLVREGCPRSRIHFVGNVMIDSLMHNLPRTRHSAILDRLQLSKGSFALATLHRPSNVDHLDTLRQILDSLKVIQASVPIIFPVHPRTEKNLHKLVSRAQLRKLSGLTLLNPLGYLDCLQLMRHAQFVLTDSGGIQQETTVLGVPCLTLRENTEWPVTIAGGTNTLVGTSQKRILQEVTKILAGRYKKGKIPRYWDGKSAQRIIGKLKELHQKGTLCRVESGKS